MMHRLMMRTRAAIYEWGPLGLVLIAVVVVLSVMSTSPFAP